MQIIHMYIILCVPKTQDAIYLHVYNSLCAKWLEMLSIYTYIILCVPND